MKNRLFAAGVALAFAALAPSAASAQCVDAPIASDPLAPANRDGLTGCGLDTNIGAGNIEFQYMGSSAGFWHSIWLFNSAGITGTPAAPTSTGPVSGQLLFCKFADCTTNGNLAPTQGPVNVAWGGGTAIFGIYVLDSNAGQAGGYTGGGYWLFSGPTNRNVDNTAHVAYFSDAVYADDRTTRFAPMPAGYDFLVGFEDKCGRNYGEQGELCQGGSDWDFNDAVIAFRAESDIVEVVPEPATMTLLATGLVGMAAARRRRRNG